VNYETANIFAQPICRLFFLYATSISPKCYKATAFDGSTALIPKQFVFGQDYEITKSDAYWISAWILGKKDLQYSSKKVKWFNKK
jgi:hypothetical protein